MPLRLRVSGNPSQRWNPTSEKPVWFGDSGKAIHNAIVCTLSDRRRLRLVESSGP